MASWPAPGPPRSAPSPPRSPARSRRCLRPNPGRRPPWALPRHWAMIAASWEAREAAMASAWRWLRMMTPAAMGAIAVLAAPPPCRAAAAVEVDIPVLVPITGFLSLEGISQRNGALLAIRHAPPGVKVTAEVSDTGTSPEVAVNALEKAASEGKPIAVAASMLGTQMLAMLPVAAGYKIPLVTVSGTAKITELKNPYVFRFFPGDEVVKLAQARYAVEILGKKRPAILYQTTAYGQSGVAVLDPAFKKLGATVVMEEGLDVKVKDMLPILSKVREAHPDVLILQLHAGPTALVVRQAAAMGLGLPIVAGSAMHQPSTAALLTPAEMKGVCAETSSSPVSSETPA